jgi:hypothetical protein
MIRAISRKSAEMFKIELSNKLSPYGPSIIPAINKPSRRGRFNLLKILPSSNPNRKINAKLANNITCFLPWNTEMVIALKSDNYRSYQHYAVLANQLWCTSGELHPRFDLQRIP